jgi:hypothetical protein
MCELVPKLRWGRPTDLRTEIRRFTKAHLDSRIVRPREHESQNRTMGIAASLYLLDKEAREDWRVGCQN